MTVRGCPKCREETAHFNGVCAKCNFGAKHYCCECNISFGLAEPRVAMTNGVAHEDCYVKSLRKQQPAVQPVRTPRQLRPAYSIH